jgi:vacuolar-type H+-ATPase subunit H
MTSEQMSVLVNIHGAILQVVGEIRSLNNHQEILRKLNKLENKMATVAEFVEEFSARVEAANARNAASLQGITEDLQKLASGGEVSEPVKARLNGIADQITAAADAWANLDAQNPPPNPPPVTAQAKSGLKSSVPAR